MNLNFFKIIRPPAPILTRNKIIKPSEIEGLEEFGLFKGVSVGPLSSHCNEVNLWNAHAHVSCKDSYEPLVGYICMLEDYVYRKGTNKPSEILWHELFHILTKYIETTNQINESISLQHNKSWEDTCINYGRPWIAASGIYVNPNWVYNPPNDGEPTWDEWDYFSNTRAINSGSSLTRAMTYR